MAIAIRAAMVSTTTISSISVKPPSRCSPEPARHELRLARFLLLEGHGDLDQLLVQEPATSPARTIEMQRGLEPDTETAPWTSASTGEADVSGRPIGRSTH